MRNLKNRAKTIASGLPHSHPPTGWDRRDIPHDNLPPEHPGSGLPTTNAPSRNASSFGRHGANDNPDRCWHALPLRYA